MIIDPTGATGEAMPSRRAFLAGSAAIALAQLAADALAANRATAASAETMVSLIERHDHAYRAFLAADVAWCDSSPEDEAACEAVAKRTATDWDIAFEELLSHRPVTLTEVALRLDYLLAHRFLGDLDPEQIEMFVASHYSA